MNTHDPAYKQFFSYPRMIEDLLRGFIHAPWVHELDFSTLERVPASYVTDDLRERLSDVVWRVNFRGAPLYICLLLEFQSQIDPWMALRLNVYTGLLLQDLVKQGALTPAGKLPPVFAMVLYNGEPRWRAKTRLEDLIDCPVGLEAYQPRFTYELLDEGRYTDEQMPPDSNLAGVLMRLENSETPQDIRRGVRLLLRWLAAAEQKGLREAFVNWLSKVVLPVRFPGTVIPEMRDLQEIDAMLAERVKRWTEEWLQQGRVEGREGQTEGEAKLLRRLLQRKFGELPAWVDEQLGKAAPEQLESWAEQVLTAHSLEDVFSVH